MFIHLVVVFQIQSSPADRIFYMYYSANSICRSGLTVPYVWLSQCLQYLVGLQKPEHSCITSCSEKHTPDYWLVSEGAASIQCFLHSEIRGRSKMKTVVETWEGEVIPHLLPGLLKQRELNITQSKSSGCAAERPPPSAGPGAQSRGGSKYVKRSEAE